MPKLPPDMEHKTTFHELNEFMNEYYSDPELQLIHQNEQVVAAEEINRSRPPDPDPKTSKMEIKVDLTGTETFGQLLNILHFAFKRADLDTQRQIYNKLKREIGKTHDLRLFER